MPTSAQYGYLTTPSGEAPIKGLSTSMKRPLSCIVRSECLDSAQYVDTAGFSPASHEITSLYSVYNYLTLQHITC